MSSFLQYLLENSHVLQEISNKFKTTEEKSPNKDEFESVSSGNAKLSYFSYPYKHMIFENVLAEDQVCQIEADLARIPMDVKYNDLFNFKQSLDLCGYKSWSGLERAHQLIINPLKQILENVSGVSFKEDNDIFFSNYGYSDYLLCHDDQTENRAIAFIYYLTPEDWSEEDGGHLELYDRYIMGYAKNAVKKYVPKRNSISLFKVSPVSFHAVEEIFSPLKERKALTGWFLYRESTELKNDVVPPSFSNYQRYTAINNDNEPREIMVETINEEYLKDEVATYLRMSMANEYQVMLSKFLKPHVYQQLLSEVLDSVNDSTCANWKKRNFPQICRINVMQESLNSEKYPTITKLRKMFKSLVFSYFIANIAGIDMFSNAKDELVGNNEDPNGTQSSNTDVDIAVIGDIDTEACFEIQHYKHGCYTLANDLVSTLEMDHNFLDVFFFVMEEDRRWHDACGGTFNYEPNPLNEDDSQPREISPVCNSLAISIKHFDENNYIKYINCRTKDGYSAEEFFIFYSRYNLEDRTIGYADDSDDDDIMGEIIEEDEGDDDEGYLQHIPDIGADYVDSSNDDDHQGDIVESDDSQ